MAGHMSKDVRLQPVSPNPDRKSRICVACICALTMKRINGREASARSCEKDMVRFFTGGWKSLLIGRTVQSFGLEDDSEIWKWNTTEGLLHLMSAQFLLFKLFVHPSTIWGLVLNVHAKSIVVARARIVKKSF